MVQDIEEKIEQLERERRRNILVVDGLEEKEGEIVQDLANKIFTDLQVGFDTNLCSAIFRRGRRPNDNAGNRANGKRGETNADRPRPLVIISKTTAEKGAVYRNLKNL